MADQSYVRLLLFLLFAVPITVHDCREMRIPDMLSMGGTLLMTLLIAVQNPAVLPIRAAEIALSVLFLLCIRSAAGKNLGLGDIKYAAFIASFLGFGYWIVSMLTASCAGIAWALTSRHTAIRAACPAFPFAPFLTAGTLVSYSLSIWWIS